jgi:iron complex outermembrane recepter protein
MSSLLSFKARARRFATHAGVSALLLGAGMTAFAAAQAAPEAEADKPKEEIVVTGTGYRVSKEALLSHVDVLTRAQLEEKPAAGLGDTLAYLPGIRSSSFAPGASRPMIRGLDGVRVQVLNNGMGAIDVAALSPDHAVPSNPAEAKRIEVLRGPSALAYGGNAIGGIVNVIDDRIPSSVTTRAVEGTFSAQGSTVDRGKEAALTLKTGTGPWVFSLDGFKHKSFDYKTPVPPELKSFSDAEGEPADTRKSQTNAFQDMSNIGAGVAYVGAFGVVGLSAKSTDYTYGTAIEQDVSIGMTQKRYDALADMNINFAGFNHLKVQGGYSDYHHTEFEGEDVGTQFFSKGSELRAALSRDGQGDISGTVGINLGKRDFSALGEESFVPKSTTEQEGVFSQFRLDKSVFGFEGGVRWDQSKVSSDQVAFDRTFSTVSGAFGSFYRPNDHAFFGLSLTRAERAPTDVELLANGPHAATAQFIIGDANFKTELGYSLEANGHILIDAHNRLAVDAHVYTSRFDDFIDLRATGETEDGLPVFAYVQTNAKLYGLEFEAHGDLAKLHSQQLSFELGYDYVHGESDLGPISRIPPQAVTLKLLSAGALTKGHIEIRHVTDRKDDLAEFETPTKGYTTTNLFISRKLETFKGASVHAELRNAFDVEMREATSATKDAVVGPGRSLVVGLSYDF